jgi:hypothetical protein
MLHAAGNADIAFLMFWFHQAARSVACDVAAGLLAMYLVDLAELTSLQHAMGHRAKFCATPSNDKCTIETDEQDSFLFRP